MLIVVIGMGCMPMSLVDEVGVVAVLQCWMPASRGVAVRVTLGDRVWRRQLIIINRLRKYGRGASPSQQVGQGPAQHEDRDCEQHDECAGRRVCVERAHRTPNCRYHADDDGADEACGETAHQIACGGHRSALTSSNPTVRIASATVMAASETTAMW